VQSGVTHCTLVLGKCLMVLTAALATTLLSLSSMGCFLCHGLKTGAPAVAEGGPPCR